MDELLEGLRSALGGDFVPVVSVAGLLAGAWLSTGGLATRRRKAARELMDLHAACEPTWDRERQALAIRLRLELRRIGLEPFTRKAARNRFLARAGWAALFGLSGIAMLAFLSPLWERIGLSSVGVVLAVGPVFAGSAIGLAVRAGRDFVNRVESEEFQAYLRGSRRT